MRRIKRPTRYVVADHVSAVLFPLFGAVVVGNAERLPVAAIPEQLAVAPVRDDVVDGCGRDLLSLHRAPRAPRMLSEEGFPGGVPLGCVATLSRARPVVPHD